MKLEADGFTEESYRRHVGRMIAAKVYLDRIRMDAADVSDAEVEQFYDDNEERLTLPEQVRVRHILLTWKPMGTQDDRAAVRKQMQPILERARAGEDFAALAREFSEDSGTRANGGDTGFFAQGTMVPDVRGSRVLARTRARFPIRSIQSTACTSSSSRSVRSRDCCRSTKFASSSRLRARTRKWRPRCARRSMNCAPRPRSRCLFRSARATDKEPL